MNASFDAYKAPLGEVLSQLSTSPEAGLTQQMVTEMRKAEGPNSTPSKHAFFPMLLIATYTLPALAVAAVLMQSGDLATATIVASASFIMAAGLYALVHHVRQAETRRARLKRQMESAQVRVVREGSVITIPARQLVPGDILLYDNAADVVIPADCRVLPGHDLRVKHSWQYSWLNGTRLPEDADLLLAGTELQAANAALIVIAIGNKRQLMRMHDDHPAGQMVRSIWHAGLWYLLAVAILLGAGLLQGIAPRIAYALAIATPVLLPFFFIRKGRGLRVQNTSNTPDHLLYPLEQLLVPKPKEAIVMLRDASFPLREVKGATDTQKSTVAQFLELMGLCLRDDNTTRHGKLLLRLVTDARRLGLKIADMEDWSMDTEQSRTMFSPETGTYCYMASFVLHDDEQENSLHLVCDDGATILSNCTYIWDDKEHTMRRRFFGGEKQQLIDALKQQTDDGSISYGLAIRENAHEDAPWIYIGALIIPQQVNTETLQELHSYAGNGHAVVFYTERAVGASFAKEALRIPQRHIFENADELTFTNLRRNDFFLTSHVDALQLRRLHDKLSGSILVDTVEDRFVSSLYFWPRYIRFKTTNTPSFFSWMTKQVRESRDGLTKGAQYAGLLAIMVLGALALFFTSPGTAPDRVFLICAATVSVLALLGLIAHSTDKQANPRKLHQLTFLDIQQGITGARVVIGALLAAAAYIALTYGALDRTALPLELLFFVLMGVGAATLSRFATDTPSLPHAVFFAVLYAVASSISYLTLFAGTSLLPADLQWLFYGALLLGGMTWIIASYQSVPERRV